MPPKQKDTLPPPPPSPSTKRPLPEVAQTSPAKKQSKWSADEDAKIIDLRGRGHKWEDISRELPGRSAISCRLHYQNYLERRSEWDEDRKNRLARLYERYAHKHAHTIDIHMYLYVCIYIKHSGTGFVHSHTKIWGAQKHIPEHLYNILYIIYTCPSQKYPEIPARPRPRKCQDFWCFWNGQVHSRGQVEAGHHGRNSYTKCPASIRPREYIYISLT